MPSVSQMFSNVKTSARFAVVSQPKASRRSAG
jgi:hypothetical protein